MHCLMTRLGIMLIASWNRLGALQVTKGAVLAFGEKARKNRQKRSQNEENEKGTSQSFIPTKA